MYYADKVLDVLSHVKFADCIIDVAALPINIWFVLFVVVPIPPWEIDNVPDVIFDAFNAVQTSTRNNENSRW